MNVTMTNSKAVFNSIKSSLTLTDTDEIHAIALAIMQKFYGFTLTDILAEKEIEAKDFSEIISRLNQHEPLQYIFGEADFYGRKFKVNPSVLIPRPETELLIDEIVREKIHSPKILDVGTGSGCIAITLKLEIPTAKVYALDASIEALNTAYENATSLNAAIEFIHQNFLYDFPFESVDVIVSNPPYIRDLEKEKMNLNVLDYEPHTALFVPDNDPLIFYRAIAEKSKSILKSNGKVFVEINEVFGEETKKLFEQHGFHSVRIIKDLNYKDRIAIAERN